jgi:hypothetical protein
MLRAIAQHVVWLSLVMGTAGFLYRNWQTTASRIELVTLILVVILFSRMEGVPDLVES